jgi:hypothetical protein
MVSHVNLRLLCVKGGDNCVESTRTKELGIGLPQVAASSVELNSS